VPVLPVVPSPVPVAPPAPVPPLKAPALIVRVASPKQRKTLPAQKMKMPVLPKPAKPAPPKKAAVAVPAVKVAVPVVAKPAPPPDYSPDILKNLPKPVAPPTDVELRRFVAEEAQWRGALSGITKPVQMSFRRRESFNSFWEQAIAPYSKSYGRAPAVDFDKDMVIGVFLGEKPLPGYDIQIVSAQIDSDGKEPVLRVRYTEINRFLGIFATHFAVQPFHLLKVAAFSGRVLFEAVPNSK
jgi:hypothetical protein